VYLPAGPGEWVDFWTGAQLAAGREVVASAPLERIPLFVPAGAIIPTTDTPDMRRLHDEPSRALRIFPGAGSGRTAFTLYEDDGLTHRYRDGDSAEVQCSLEWTPKAIRLHVDKRGGYPLPYAAMRVMAPPGERRPVRASGEAVRLEIAGRR
jgi:alpha-glucosidase